MGRVSNLSDLLERRDLGDLGPVAILVVVYSLLAGHVLDEREGEELVESVQCQHYEAIPLLMVSWK